MKSPPSSPNVDCEQLHPLLRVGDLRTAIGFYTGKLGFTLGFTWGDPPEMAGVNLGGVSVHLAVRGPGSASAGSAVYFVIGDADELHAFHQANGVEVIRPPGDRDYELRDYFIRDPDGNELGFGHRIRSVGDPVLIERVDVPVRLEKRLAALLRDLAEHKGMSVNSCLEETLLHTFEPLGGGVASPHTPTTLKHIQELKRRHGIEYDCHASYRFVERNPS
jgi:catechol 2,3-dioxygenase-like lactoylglutathione lyase family enzyme